jgi:hypothetical protein
VEKTVFGHLYLIGRLDAIQQFHVMRRLGAVSSGLGEGIARLQRSGGARKLLDTGGEGALDVISPLLIAVGEMSQENVDYVLDTCLGVVQRQEGKIAWSPIRVSGKMMYPDVDMPAMVMIVWHVLEFNLKGFFSTLLSALPEVELEK